MSRCCPGRFTLGIAPPGFTGIYRDLPGHCRDTAGTHVPVQIQVVFSITGTGPPGLGYIILYTIPVCVPVPEDRVGGRRAGRRMAAPALYAGKGPQPGVRHTYTSHMVGGAKAKERNTGSERVSSVGQNDMFSEFHGQSPMEFREEARLWRPLFSGRHNRLPPETRFLEAAQNCFFLC